MIYGNARVLADGQIVDAQTRQLAKARRKKVFRGVASGPKTDRAQLRRLLGQLDDGDVPTVTRLDRLVRSTRHLLNTLAEITGRKTGFRSLGEACEGRARAVVHGVKLGLEPKQMREAVTCRANGEPVREIARSYALNHSTISRLQAYG